MTRYELRSQLRDRLQMDRDIAAWSVVRGVTDDMRRSFMQKMARRFWLADHLLALLRDDIDDSAVCPAPTTGDRHELGPVQAAV